MDREIDLARYYPSVMREIREFQAVAETENPEFRQLFQVMQDALNSAFVQDANDAGIKRWEKILGVHPKANESLEERRARIQAHLIKKEVSRDTILGIAQSLFSGEVSLHVYPGEYRFQVDFSGALHDSFNIDLFRSIVDELKPAHLTYGVSLESVYPEIRLSCVGAMSPGWTSTLLPEWEMQYDYRAVQNIAGRTETIIETVLPPFKEESM